MAKSIYDEREVMEWSHDQLIATFKDTCVTLGMAGESLPPTATLPHDVALLDKELTRRLAGAAAGE